MVGRSSAKRFSEGQGHVRLEGTGKGRGGGAVCLGRAKMASIGTFSTQKVAFLLLFSSGKSLWTPFDVAQYYWSSALGLLIFELRGSLNFQQPTFNILLLQTLSD